MPQRIALLALTLIAIAACTDPASPGPDATLGDDGLDGGLETGPDGWYDPTLLPDGAPNPCLGARDCEECTSRSPCGWCNGSCLAGVPDHSFDLTCSGDTWLWRGVQCPGTGTQCPSHTDCASCAADENSCGWCSNSNSCVAGDSNGPAVGVSGCVPASGTWVYNLMMMTCP